MFKYHRIVINAKNKTNENTIGADMLYRAYLTEGKKYNFVNFAFNPEPYPNEENYRKIIYRILNKNKFLSSWRVKSAEVNFDYYSKFSFDKLYNLSKILTEILSKEKYKVMNINADIKKFDSSESDYKDRYYSYKWYKYKGKNKLLEVKLYKKEENKIRFEIIFHNTENRHFKEIEDSFLSSGGKIYKTFNKIYSNLLMALEEKKEFLADEGIAEFIKVFKLNLEELKEEINNEKVA